MHKQLFFILMLLISVDSMAQYSDQGYYMGKVECVSGNCKKGFGRVRLIGWDGMEVEATFEKGDPNNDPVKMYNKSGQLLYEGDEVGWSMTGKGKKYAIGADNKVVVIEEGKFDRGVLREGIKRDLNGIVLSRGYYSWRGVQEDGAKRIMYKGKPAYIFPPHFWLDVQKISDIEEGPIYIRETDDVTSKPLYQTVNKKNVPNSYIIMNDYDSGLHYSDIVSKGVPELDDKDRPTGRISDINLKKSVATFVKFTGEFDAQGYFTPKVLEGVFTFDDGPERLVKVSAAESSMAKIKELYATAPAYVPIPERVMTQAEIDARSAGIDKAIANMKAKQGQDAGSEIKNYLAEVREIHAAVKRRMGAITKQSYDADKKFLAEKRTEILTRLDYLISKYEGVAPGQEMADLKYMRKDIADVFVMDVGYGNLRDK